MDLGVLERYRGSLTWLQQHDFTIQNDSFHHHHHQQSFVINNGGDDHEGVEISCDKISLISKRKAESFQTNQSKSKRKLQEGLAENSSTETSADTSKENSKPDFIHVRARRGQATDSHSLAERVRREKLSKKMKCLQDLVPGCNKITGKAGMLDEIINYVQSLQRQVDFLSMKLAVINSDSNIENLCVKELSAYAANFPANLPYAQLNLVQEGSTNNDPVNQSQAHCFSHQQEIIQSFLNWDSDLQTLYNNNY